MNRKPRLETALLLALLVGTHAHGLELFDDFRDGNPTDGTPVLWKRADAGVLETNGCDLMMWNPGVQEAYIETEATFTGNVSVRTEVAFLNTGGAPGEIFLFTRDGSCWTWGTLRSSGAVSLHRGGAALGTARLADFERSADHLVQLDIQGDRVELRVWRSGEPMPAEPLLEAVDSLLCTGVAGVGLYFDPPGSGENRGVFRYVWIADEMISGEALLAPKEGDCTAGDILGPLFLGQAVCQTPVATPVGSAERKAFEEPILKAIQAVNIDRYEARIYSDSGGPSIPYRLFVPENYDPTERYPLVVYLHGSGARGSDNVLQLGLSNITGSRVWATPQIQAQFPSFVAVPQTVGNWRGEDAELVVGIVEDLGDEFTIDEDRIYVTGFSMGCTGSWHLLRSHPDLFAAAIPVGGFANTSWTVEFPHVALWVFHGSSDDPVVARAPVRALWDAGGSPLYTEYDGVAHSDTPPLAYTEPNLATWLFSQRRGVTPPGPRADYTASAYAVLVSEEILFDGVSSTTPEGTLLTSHEWDFGDTIGAEGAQIRHAFSDPGRYVVTLTVSNNEGYCHEVRKTIVAQCPGEIEAPWQTVDVGQPDFPGGSRLESDGDDSSLVLCAGGRGIGDKHDQFHFAYQQWSGDGTVTVLVEAIEVSGRIPAEVGVTVRESLEPGARHATVLLLRNSVSLARSRFIHRPGAGGATQWTQRPGLFRGDVWLRLERLGDVLIGSTSRDRVTWSEVSRATLELPQTALFGITVGGGDWQPGETFLATGVKVSSLEISESAPLVFLRGDCNDNGQVDISDGRCILDWRFSGAAAPGCLAATNTNGDGSTNIADAIYLFSALFLGGPPPVLPFPECGVGTLAVDDELGCVTSACE